VWGGAATPPPHPSRGRKKALPPYLPGCRGGGDGVKIVGGLFFGRGWWFTPNRLTRRLLRLVGGLIGGWGGGAGGGPFWNKSCTNLDGGTKKKHSGGWVLS